MLGMRASSPALTRSATEYSLDYLHRLVGVPPTITNMDQGLQIVPYDPTWPIAFQFEAARIRAALGALALRIHHNGSTAVPGLAAKPIIDIQVSVKSLQPIEVYRDPLSQLGYVHVAHADDSFCPFFHRPADWPHTHHVHVVAAGGAEEQRTLAFRDYLCEHEDAAREYEHIKRNLAARLARNDAASREAYANAKTDFIERTVALALSAGYPRLITDYDA